jgi:hypothetical protein
MVFFLPSCYNTNMSMDLKQLLGKPVISGTIAAVTLPMLSGGKEYIYNGVRYPLWGLGMGLGFASSFIAEATHKYLLPHIPGNEKYLTIESMVLSVATSSGAFVLGAKMINSDINMSEMKTFAMAGAAAEVLSGYIATNLLSDGTL